MELNFIKRNSNGMDLPYDSLALKLEESRRCRLQCTRRYFAFCRRKPDKGRAAVGVGSPPPSRQSCQRLDVSLSGSCVEWNGITRNSRGRGSCRATTSVGRYGGNNRKRQAKNGERATVSRKRGRENEDGGMDCTYCAKYGRMNRVLH